MTAPAEIRIDLAAGTGDGSLRAKAMPGDLDLGVVQRYEGGAKWMSAKLTGSSDTWEALAYRLALYARADWDSLIAGAVARNAALFAVPERESACPPPIRQAVMF